MHVEPFFGKHLVGRLADDLFLVLEFGGETGQRNHDFGMDVDAVLLDVASGLEDRPGLHAVISG